MVDIPFVKYEGAGNDFVVLESTPLLSCDDSLASILYTETLDRKIERLIRFLCDRKRGVGADGLMLCLPPEKGDALHSMRYYNRDGGRASFCGNGARCFAHFLHRKLGSANPKIHFNSDRGQVAAEVGALGDGLTLQVELSLGNVPPVEYHPESGGMILDTGVPHLVIPVDDVRTIDLPRQGCYWRENVHPETGGVNVDFYTRRNSEVHVRTYERGVEDETLSCGTGVVATALASGVSRVVALGGEFTVRSEGSPQKGWNHVTLTGPVRRVFTGLFSAPKHLFQGGLPSLEG